ncbi:MAG: RyR domain-containing protein [Frankia sp.]
MREVRSAPRWLARAVGRHLLALFVLVGIVAYGLGVLGMREFLLAQQAQRPPGGTFTWANALYFAGTLFIADTTPFQNFTTYPATLEVARFLAPVATSLGLAKAVGALFAGQLRAWRARHCHDHVVVCGAQPVAGIVAAAARAEGHRVVLVTDRSGDEDETSPAEGILAIPGDPGDPATLRAAGIGRAARLVICSERGLGGVSVAAAARTLAREARAPRPFWALQDRLWDRRWRGRDGPLECFAQAGDVDFVVPVQVRAAMAPADPSFVLTFFSLEAVGGRILAGADVPGFDARGPREVVVVGTTEFGRALVVELARAWRSRFGDQAAPLPVALAAPDAAAVADGLKRRYHVVRSFLRLRAIGVEPALVRATPAAHVYICEDDSDAVIADALALARADEARPARGTGARTVVTLLLGREQTRGSRGPGPGTGDGPGTTDGAGVLDDAGGRLRFFALYGQPCRPAEIYGETYLRMARAIHDNYVSDLNAPGAAPGSADARVPWDALPEPLRHSNIEQARSYATALDALGYVIVPTQDAPVAVRFTDAEVERLARAEHDRWMAAKIATGFSLGERDEGPTKHPDLLPWDDLSDPVREKDRQPMRRMPAVLGLVDLQIVRRSPS